MTKPGDLKSPRGVSGPTVKTTNATTVTTAAPSIALINQPVRIKRDDSRAGLVVFNTSGPNQRKQEKGNEVSTRSPSHPTTPDSDWKIGNQLFAKLGPGYRVRSADRNESIRKRANPKQFEIRPTSSKPDENKVSKPKRNASYALRFAAMTVGSAVSAAVGKMGKAFDKAGESRFADDERALLPATMADLSNAEILKIFKHVERPKADSEKYLREVAAGLIPPEGRTYPLLYLRAFVKGRKFNSEQDLCQGLIKDLTERTNHGAASNQLSELFNCKPNFEDLIAGVAAWDESPLKRKVQVLVQGAKASFDSR